MQWRRSLAIGVGVVQRRLVLKTRVLLIIRCRRRRRSDRCAEQTKRRVGAEQQRVEVHRRQIQRLRR